MGDVAVKLYAPGEAHAKGLIAAGKVDKTTSWSIDANEEDAILGDPPRWSEYGSWHLGADDAGPDNTKAHWKYPYGKDGKVYREALVAIRRRAAQNGATEIYDAAGRLIDDVDGDADGDMEKKHAAGLTTRELGPLTLRADIQPATIDAAERTVEVVFSTGAPVERYDWMAGERYIETLSLKPGAVRLDRLNAGAPVLNAHSAWALGDVIGAVKPGSARVDGSQGTATMRFSRRPEIAGIWQDVQDGIIRNVSVGYRVYRYEQTTGADGKLPTRTAVDWEPFEISPVPIPADAAAQMRARDAKSIETNRCAIVTRATQERNVMDHVFVSTRVQNTCDTCGGIETDAPHTKPAPAPVIDPTDPGAPLRTEPTRTTPAAETDRAQGAAAERERCQGIQRAVSIVGLPQALADRLIRDGIALVDARGQILEELGKLEQGGPRVNGVAIRDAGGIREVGDPVLPMRAGIENALLHRAAPHYFKLEEIGRQYMGLSLLETAKYCLQARGIRTTGLSKMEIAGLALGLNQRGGMHTVSDFQYILADVANKTLRRAYDEAPATYTTFARRVELPDFKPVSRTQLGEAPQLLEVKEHGEFTRGTIGNAKETYQLATYGRVFAITRQALVNDDMNAFDRLALLFGRMARQLEADLVWAQITGNPTMGDGVALFHADHGNLSDSGGAMDVDTIGAGRAAMRRQLGLDGVQRLNIMARYLAVPTSLETKADQFVSVNLVATAAEDVNPFAGRLQVIAEPRLDDTPSIGTTAWYLISSPDQIDTVEYGFLAGENGPAVETRVGFDVDGLEVKCRHDVAAKVIDYRGFYRNDGE